MTFNEIEKEFEELQFPIWFNAHNEASMELSKFVLEVQSPFLKQSFIKYLQSEVERLEKTLIRNEEFGFCKHCPFHKGDMEHDFGKCAGHDEAISDQITHITNQIKEIESLSN